MPDCISFCSKLIQGDVLKHIQCNCTEIQTCFHCLNAAPLATDLKAPVQEGMELERVLFLFDVRSKSVPIVTPISILSDEYLVRF